LGSDFARAGKGKAREKLWRREFAWREGGERVRELAEKRMVVLSV